MFNQPSNTLGYNNLIKSIQQVPIPTTTTTTPFPLKISIPGHSNNNSTNHASTSTATNTLNHSIQQDIESIGGWKYDFGNSQQQQQQHLIENNGLHCATTLSNSTNNNNLGPTHNQRVLEHALSLLISNRNSSQGSALPNAMIGFSPTLSNNLHNSQTFNMIPPPLDATSCNLLSSLPNLTNNFMSGKNFLSANTQEFNQPFIVKSDYKVSTTNNQENSESLNGILNGFFQPKTIEETQPSIFGNFNPTPFINVDQISNNTPNHQQLINIHPINQLQSNSLSILNLLTPTPPTSPSDQQFAQQVNIRQGFSPNSSISPSTCVLTNQPFNISTPNMNPTISTNSTCGKQRKQRALSNSTSVSSPGYQPYTPTMNHHCTNTQSEGQLANTQSEIQLESPKKFNKKSIKFQVEWSNDAQKFEHKHTNFTPTSMKKQIADKNERERNGSKRRGRPKGSGIKQQQQGKKCDLLFYQNCYNSVVDLYKGKNQRDTCDRGGSEEEE